MSRWDCCCSSRCSAAGGPTALVRARRRSVSICAGVLVAATGAYVAWSMAMGRTHAGLELSPLLPSLSDAWHQLSLVWEQAVGVVSWINVYLPASLYREYLLTALILLTLALRFGEGRERLILVGTTAAALLAPVLLNQWLLRPPSDQGVQGRYVLPLLALVPLLSGHVLSRNAQKVGPFLRRWGPALIVCLIAFVEVAALIYVARFVTGGALPSFSIQHAQWAPPLGWGVWLLLTVLGGGSLALWGVSLLVPEPAESAIAARRSSPSA